MAVPVEQAPTQGILVALGQNWEKGRHGSTRLLNANSINTTKAADVLLQTGKYHTLIFSTGHTNGPHHAAEADAMANVFEVIRHDGRRDVPVLRESKSFDTPSNIHEVMALIAEQQLTGPITVVAPHYHMQRVLTTTKGLGLPVATSYEAEKVLGIANAPTPVWEYVLRPLAKLDPEGTIPRALWTRRRIRG